MLNRFKKFLLFAYPELLLEGTPWRGLWQAHLRREYSSRAPLVLFLTGLVVLAHHWIVDLKVNAQPEVLWMAYRFGLGSAGVLLSGTLLAFKRLSQRVALPTLTIYFVALTLVQTATLLWDHRSPPVFIIVIPFLFLSCARISLRHSAAFLSVTFLLQIAVISKLKGSTDEMGPIFLSGYIVLLITVGMNSSAYKEWLNSFVSQQEIDKQKAAVFQEQRNLVEQLRGFMSREHFRRITDLAHTKKISIVEATDLVLRPTMKFVAFSFSDIKDYTKTSNKNIEYVNKGVLQNIKQLTSIVDNNRGVPRLIGDLIASYHDSRTKEESVRECCLTLFMMIQKNEELNKIDDAHLVKRRFIAAFGEALVGNIGADDHAREITALGPCVNLCQRIDEYVKSNGSISRISDDHVICSTEFAKILISLYPSIVYTIINFNAKSIRDFELIDSLMLVPLNQSDGLTMVDILKNEVSYENSHFTAA